MSTSSINKIEEGEVYISNNKENGLDKTSKILVKYPYTIKKDLCLIEKLGNIDSETINKVQIV
jgi:hypothetical protein